MHPGVAGEIIPQSICTRHGLRVGANCIWVVKVFMCVPLHCLLCHHPPTTLDGTVHKLTGRNCETPDLGGATVVKTSRARVEGLHAKIEFVSDTPVLLGENTSDTPVLFRRCFLKCTHCVQCSALMSPIAYPISLVLDCVLGRDIGTVYSQEEFKRLMCAPC